MKRVSFLSGFLLAILLCSCSAWTFHYYGLDGMDYSKGSLLGASVTEDLPFSVCTPTQVDKSPCIIMLAKDFYAMKQEYQDTVMRLRECEKKN